MVINHKIAFLERVLGKGQYSNNSKELGVFCPWCGHHKKKLFINLETDFFHCFPCGKAGHGLVYLIRKVGSNADVDTYIKSFKAKDVRIKEAETTETEAFKVELPDKFTPLAHCENVVAGQRAITYLSRRNVTKQDILRYKLGISFSQRYENRVILPSFSEDGTLNFFTGRSFIGSPLKYQDPETPKGYKKNIIINELNIDWSKPIVIVEGFFDMLKADNAIPLFGSAISPDYILFQKIIRSNTRVYIGLDADAHKKALAMSELFAKYEMEVYNIDVSPFHDIGEMTKEQFREKLAGAIEMNRNSVLLDRIRNLK